MGRLPESADHRSGYCSRNGVFYSKRPPVRIPENLDLLSFLFAHQLGDKVALIDALTGRSLTYRELEQSVCALATGLFNVVGVRRCDVVVLLLSNSIEFPVSFFAVTWLGAVVTTLNPLNTARELEKQITDAGAKYIITSAELLEKINAAQLPTVIVGSMETVPRLNRSNTNIYCYSDLLQTGQPNVARPQAKHSDTVSILFSSGTTGRSKGVALTHRNYISAVCRHMPCEGDNLTRMLALLPMFHAYGFTVCMLMSLARGISVIILRKFEVVSLLTAIQRYRVTHMCFVPPIVKALVNLDGVHNKFDLRSWVQVACGGAPLGMDTIAAFVEKYPSVKSKQEYGMTETTGCISTLPIGDDDHVGSAGTLLPCWEAMVVDVVSKQPVSVGKPGELWVRGASVMKEYINNPEATEEAIDKNGWLRTGDLVRFDEDGYLYLVDRLKELIKYNGYQVAPVELEDLLSSHPAVLDCAVIPYPDKSAGQIPMACIVRRGGLTLTSDDFMQWVAKQVAPYKKIRKVAFVDTIPKSAAGKILRRELVNSMTLRSNL